MTTDPLSKISKISAGIETLYEHEQRLLFAYYARMAYENNADAKAMLSQLAIKNVHYIDIEGAQVFVFYNQFDLVISCRGTEPSALNDILADLEIIKSTWSSTKNTGFVHRGFKEEVDKVYADILQYVLQNGTNKKIWVTGHSLGAAMATQIAAKLIEDDCQIQCVYTFGSPRAGDADFASWCDKHLTHKRFINNNDIVPCIPTVLRWRHSGQCNYIKSSGAVITLGDISLARFLDKSFALVIGLINIRLDAVADHSMDDYVRQLGWHKN